jgi:fatty acid desaturase
MKNLLKTLLLIIALPIFLALIIVGLPILILIVAIMFFLAGGRAFRWSNFDKMRQGYFNNGKRKNADAEMDENDEVVDIDCKVVEVNEESEDKQIRE